MDETLRLAGRLMGVDIPAPELDDATRAHLAKYRFGSVCLFRKNVRDRHQLARLVAELREVLGPECLISIDQEGGAVQRTTDLPEAPAPMAIGATGDAGLAEAVGGAVGRSLIALGINWNFAPSLDVNTNPLNPVIGDRSFGSDPAKVAELGLAWAKGLEQAGVMACVKHFPGHGDTHLDSHLDLPTVGKPRALLERLEFLPFRRAAEAGVGSFMTAHIVYPELDPDYPATLSSRILSGLLRQEWGYDGLVVTDSMDMKAITKFSPDAGAAAVRAFNAGADTVLALGPKPVQAAQAEALAKAIADGTIPRARLEHSLERLARAARAFPGTPRPYSTQAEAADRALMKEAAARSLTRHGPVRLPRPADRVLFVAPDVAPGESAYENGPAAQDLARRLKERFPGLRTLAYPRQQPQAVLASAQAAAKESDFILYVSTTRQQLSHAEAELAQALFALDKPALHVALWNPYHVQVVRQPALITYGWRPPTLEALVEALNGAEAPGKLPVELAG
ncbi:Beta-hexosaminidase [Calidithermus terrae]|uniref:Beta-hexosaminidase n=1 Tax=Calidithermus terrae TaxID=1408545 RepID=A0A399EHI4_9DEIN|nr:glycoside hydrolase family 3 protein [Calidithermus terrae]RIH82589.1 Beta-hexosaminidase [Calidithermus terrae]